MSDKHKSALEYAGEDIQTGGSEDMFELGRLTGGAQMTGFIARQCSFAEAQMIKRIKDTGAYKAKGDWEQYCPQYLGISRNTADRIVKNLETYGQDFFAISQFTRLSPDTYSQLLITDGKLLIDGEEVAIVKANEGVIKAHIAQVQQQLTKEREAHCNTRGVLTKVRGEKEEVEQKTAKIQEALAAYENPLKTWPNSDDPDHARLLQMQVSLDLICSQLRGFASREVSPESQAKVVAFAKYAWAEIHQAGELACNEYGVGMNAPVPAEWLNIDAATQDRRNLVAEYIEEHVTQ